jgi:predicted dienelactone hydrolase
MLLGDAGLGTKVETRVGPDSAHERTLPLSRAFQKAATRLPKACERPNVLSVIDQRIRRFKLPLGHAIRIFPYRNLPGASLLSNTRLAAQSFIDELLIPTNYLHCSMGTSETGRLQARARRMYVGLPVQPWPIREYVLRFGPALGAVQQRSAPGGTMQRYFPIRGTAGPITAAAVARCRKLAFGIFTLASIVLAACGGGSGNNGPPITISVSADPQMVQPGATAQVTAVVSNDTAGRGVSWTVSCSSAPCGAVSPSSTASAAATTYTAPPTHPAADLAVNITATSVSDSSVAGSATVTVAGGVAFTEIGADSATVLAGSTTHLVAMLINDPANRGVSWTPSCSTAPCGTISPSTSASGAPVTYTAPANIPAADLTVTVTASAVSAPSVQATESLTVPALAISVDPSGTSMAAGTTTQFTASANYPAAVTAGIAWKAQCGVSDCGTVSPASSASGAPVSYTAPAGPVPTDLAVTLTANSVSAPSVQVSATITVGAIAVGVTPVSALIPLNATQPFTGNVTYDSSAGQLNWSLAQKGITCAMACGTVSPALAADGSATSYTAPSVLPTDPTVTVTATSASDPTKTATATVMLTNGSVKLVPADLNFIKVKRGAECCIPPPQTATLTNTGTSPLAIGGITIGGTAPKLFSQSTTCGSSLDPGASCDVTVKYNYQQGQGTAVLSITDSSSDSPQKINLSGTRQPAVAATARSAMAQQRVLAAPRPTGANEVGTRELYLIDSGRANPYVANGSPRELMVRFWYPTATNAGNAACARADYTSPQTWKYLGTLLGITLPQVLTNSCRNAPIAAGPHPVVFLSHGFTGTSTDYTFLAEDLASRGYVVAAIDHTYEATAVAFPDGRLEKSVLGSYLTNDWHSDSGTLGFAVAVRLADLRFVLGKLTALNSGRDSGFTGSLDLSRIAIVGHSLGGLTVLRALESEPRFKAGVLLDAVVPPHLAAPLKQPVLHVVVGRDQWNEVDCTLWSALGGTRLAVSFPGAEHIALSDAVWLLKGKVRTGTTSDAMIAATREYVATFLDSSLRDEARESVPGGPRPSHPQAVVAAQGQPRCDISSQ